MIEIVQTADGSNTLYNSEVGENYHSRNGALQESRHVFINAGLQYFLDKNADTADVSILEVGFGTGLNFLLSADFCRERQLPLLYTGIEAFPVSLNILGELGYDQYVSPDIWEKFIAFYTDSLLSDVALDDYCHLQVAHSKLADYNLNKQYDIIYFDAFASARQPEMWDEAAIAHTVQFLKPGGVFVTYAITGNLKRALKALGCKIEKLPGAAGKREMLRAVKF